MTQPAPTLAAEVGELRHIFADAVEGGKHAGPYWRLYVRGKRFEEYAQRLETSLAKLPTDSTAGIAGLQKLKDSFEQDAASYRREFKNELAEGNVATSTDLSALESESLAKKVGNILTIIQSGP